jgi:tRNA threonylcarbamoyladenosine biosynthesis protein TsaE
VTTIATHDVDSVEQTMDVATRLAGILREGDVVYLSGELGTGKTHFVKGMARGLGIDPDDVRSPTFTFVDLHAPAGPPGSLGLVHVDLYRVAGEAELVELGLTELPGAGAVAAIEWPERLAARAPAGIHVRILDLGGSLRQITIETP